MTEISGKKSDAGSLIIVGSGIKAICHLTLESINAIKYADQVFYVVTDDIIENYIINLNSRSQTLKNLYIEGQERYITYNNMKKVIVESVMSGNSVCAVFYGHPGVFVTPSHELIEDAAAFGFSAVMLPGISAEDCLFSDLGVDPALQGCQSYEATHFLFHRKVFDPTSALVLWQVGSISDPMHSPSKSSTDGLAELKRKLIQFYDPSHMVAFYEAAIYVVSDPIIEWVELRNLDAVGKNGITTLYVPPISEDGIVDIAALDRAGLSLRRNVRSAVDPKGG